MASARLDTLLSYLSNVLGGFVSDLVLSVIIILIGFILAKIIGKSAQKILSELELDTWLKRLFDFKISVEEVIGQFITYIGYFISIVLALNQLKVTTEVLYIISTLVVAMLVLSVLIGIKDYVPNAFAGFLLWSRKFIQPNDHIRVGNIEGVVESQTLTETIIKTSSNDRISIPNAKIIKSEVVKFKKKVV